MVAVIPMIYHYVLLGALHCFFRIKQISIPIIERFPTNYIKKAGFLFRVGLLFCVSIDFGHFVSILINCRAVEVVHTLVYLGAWFNFVHGKSQFVAHVSITFFLFTQLQNNLYYL